MSNSVSSQSKAAPASTMDNAEANRKHIAKCYQADQQVKYLHLEAEIDVLFQQVQSLRKTK